MPRCSLLLLLHFVLLPQPATATWPTNPAVNVGIGVGPYYQGEGRVVTDEQGGAFVVWVDERSGSADIYIRRVRSDGTRWPAIGVGVGVEMEDELHPRVVTDGAGGAIVVWDRATYGIRAQRVDANGAILWSAGGIIVATGNARNPEVTADSQGGIVVVWKDVSNKIWARRFDASGDSLWAGRAQLYDGTDRVDDLAIVEDGSGGAIVAWTRNHNGDEDVLAQRVSAVGQTLWGASGTAVHAGFGDQDEPFLLADNSGGAYVAYGYNDGGYQNTRVQRLDANGQYLWPAGGINPTSSFIIAGLPVLAQDGAGGVIVKWENGGENFYQTGGDIYGQRFDGNGNKLWGSFGVKVIDDDDTKRGGTLTVTDGGGSVFIWTTNPGGSSEEIWDVYGQRLDANGNLLWPSGGMLICNALNRQENLHIVNSTFGGVIAIWDDFRRDGDVMAQRVNWNGTLGPEPTDVAPLEGAGRLGLRVQPSSSGSVEFTYWIPAPSRVSVQIHDVRGRTRAEHDLGRIVEGPHVVELDIEPLPPGVYWLTLRTDEERVTRRFLIAR